MCKPTLVWVRKKSAETDSTEGKMFNPNQQLSQCAEINSASRKILVKKKKKTNKKNPPQRETPHQFFLTHSLCMNVILFPWFSLLSSTWSLLYPFINRCCTQMNPSYFLQPLYERWMTKGEEFLSYQRQGEQRRVSWTNSTGTDWGAGVEPGGLFF